MCVCWGWGGGLFYYTTDAASLVKGLKSCWDIRGNYATKSTVAECVKRLCLDCVAELLAAFLESSGGGGVVWVRLTVPIQDILHKND